MGARVGSLVDVGIPDITPPSAQPGIKEEGRARIRPAPRDPMTPKMKDPARAGGANRASRCSVLRTACPSIIAPTGRGQQRYAELLGRHAPARGIRALRPRAPALPHAFEVRTGSEPRSFAFAAFLAIASRGRRDEAHTDKWVCVLVDRGPAQGHGKAAQASGAPQQRASFACDLGMAQIDRSAQDSKEGGKFEFDGGLFAFDERVEQETIDAIVKVFELPEVALIVDGRSATFIPPEPSRDAKYNKTRRHRTIWPGQLHRLRTRAPPRLRRTLRRRLRRKMAR